MTLLALMLAQLYLVCDGGDWLSGMQYLKIFGLILLTSFCNTSLMLLVVRFVKSQGAYVSVTVVLGTLIGFITGIYLPMSMFPEAAQWVVKLFPTSRAVLLFRQVMAMPLVESGMAGIPPEFGTAAELNEALGNVFYYGNTAAPPWVSVLVLAVCGLVCLGLSALLLSRKKK